LFQEVPSKTDFARLEEEILALWEDRGIFLKSIAQREGCEEYVFYDGPPFATGLPHYGHLLAGTIKDIVPRYWTMQGKLVRRRFGWDCHGLPVENEAAKDLKQSEGLDLSGKYEIEQYGIGKFNEYCRSIVQKYTAEWEIVVKRMGRWVDFEDSYRTMDRSFMESIWWVFKQLWDKGLVYQGHRVMPFSWKLSTPLSNFEANMNYKEVQDPAITVRFKSREDDQDYFLAWTTTPWTLPSNLALAVRPDITYARVRLEGKPETYILAEATLADYEKKLKTKSAVLETFAGRELLGRTYEPLLPYFEGEADHGAFRIIASTHVTVEDGTGIVHMAPAYGEDDFEACREAGIRMVDPIDMEGRFTHEVTDFQGLNVKEADKGILKRLKEEGKILHHGTTVHSYPFCWRSDTPLIYKTIKTWFVKVEQLKDRMVANNKQIHWVPEAIGTNRFGNWLEDARDWNISRNRYWGTPLPIWECEQSGDQFAIGSIAELEQLSGQEVPDLHSHFIDKLTVTRDGRTYKRVPEVFDCWFESGSMPYAQNHYPFENKASFEANFPADFIAEGLDQTRGWFYTLTVLSTALFDKPAFRNVVVNGLILAEDGQKMSKSKKNYPDPMEIIHRYGADCLRAYMIDSPVVRAEPFRFQEKNIALIYRKVVSPFWNAYSFLVTYANIDGYRPQGDLTGSPHQLDRWVISQFQSLVKDVAGHMRGSYLYNVIPELEGFIDLMTNWYVRRSRRRFWRATNDEDKRHAYNTLYYIVSEFSKVMAPFLPFISEAIYQNLVGSLEGDEAESVHLCDYPQSIESLIDTDIEREMNWVRQVVAMGRSLRAKNDLKVRQPLANLSLVAPSEIKRAIKDLKEIVQDELNVKAIEFLEDETELVHYSARPNLKQLGPRLGKAMREVVPAIRGMNHRDIQTLLDQGATLLAGHQLDVDDFLIDREEKQGMVVAAEGKLTIALDTRLTDELRNEGDARELINRIQFLRKEADFNVEERIRVRLDGDWVPACLEAHGAYVAGETLAEEINQAAFEPEISRDWEVNGKPVHIALART